MRIIAFITFSADIQKNLNHIGVESEAPRITPARGPTLWDACSAQEMGDGVEALLDWDMAAQPAPDYPEWHLLSRVTPSANPTYNWHVESHFES